MAEKTRRRKPKWQSQTFKGMEGARVEIPVEERELVHMSGRVAVQRLTYRQRKAYRMIFDGLEGRAELANGRRVTVQGDAIRWVLERIADDLGLEP